MATGRISAEVRDDNPYSRLMALQKMGVVNEYEKILDKTALIVGVGGVGSVTAEMLTRCGIGKLILIDYDTVELANMNRLFYQPSQCGMKKVNAAVETLTNINSDVELEPLHMNITTVDNFDILLNKITNGSKTGGQIDLVLCCVDNFEARLALNQACLEANQVWMESGVSENAVSGHVQVLVPGSTPCYQCVPPLVVATGEKQPKREGVCAASLPTTMGIIAGFLSQAALKYLLQFGQVSPYIGYDSLTDSFPSITLKANPECSNATCLRKQQEFKLKPAAVSTKPTQQQTAPINTDNEWGISIIEECAGDDVDVQPGLQFDFLRSEEVGDDPSIEPSDLVAGSSATVEDLAAKLKAMSS
eukprot:TRINITY_DN11926_c1_g1_i1.p1 TRINITY_DN11926_c1_g1~~TRINITY_DN11926_c1_g1_i1.p1  ORF type:complete len:376 (+),score=73.38 TRINITY_DN11926_c1_g1_i1:48-1130(+)